MWIWSCGVCLMRTCPSTCERLFAAWCCTCMWTVTRRNRSPPSNTLVCGPKFPLRLLLMSEFRSAFDQLTFPYHRHVCHRCTVSLRCDSPLIIQLWQRWNHQRWNQRAFLPHYGFCGELPPRGGITEHPLHWQGEKQAYLRGTACWMVRACHIEFFQLYIHVTWFPVCRWSTWQGISYTSVSTTSVTCSDWQRSYWTFWTVYMSALFTPSTRWRRERKAKVSINLFRLHIVIGVVSSCMNRNAFFDVLVK